MRYFIMNADNKIADCITTRGSVYVHSESYVKWVGGGINGFRSIFDAQEAQEKFGLAEHEIVSEKDSRYIESKKAHEASCRAKRARQDAEEAARKAAYAAAAQYNGADSLREALGDWD